MNSIYSCSLYKISSKLYYKIKGHSELKTFVVTLFLNVPGLKLVFHSLNGQYLQTTLPTSCFYLLDLQHQIGYLYYFVYYLLKLNIYL